MITAVHTLVYADDAERARTFFRDVLGWPAVDAGQGWLIFATGPSELGVHPTDPSVGQHHAISLMCDDIEATVADLRQRGVEFTRDVRDDGFGLTAMFVVPGGGEMMLYEPRHPTAFDRT
jgi:predicted enzyme related to lactoylglutathione lyase